MVQMLQLRYRFYMVYIEKFGGLRVNMILRVKKWRILEEKEDQEIRKRGGRGGRGRGSSGSSKWYKRNFGI